MRAVIIATGYCPAMQSLEPRELSVLLPVAGKPFLHHVVESLVDSGIHTIDLILAEMPERIEESLGDGTRWGIALKYHLARDAAHPYGRLAILGLGETEFFVLAHGDRLPLWNLDSAAPRAQMVFHGGEWAGWGMVTGAAVRNLANDLDEPGLGGVIASRLSPAACDTELVLDASSYERLLDANWAVLEKRFPKLLVAGREAAEGIWLSRNVSLHPTAQLRAPVYIGENCRISSGVQLGPRVVVGSDCLLDQSSVLSDTIVLPGSYVGEFLELRDAIVDRNRLVNVKVGAAITVTDNFILGSFAERHLRQLAGSVISRILGGLLLAVLSPLLLLGWLFCKIAGRGRGLHRKRVVRLPASGPEYVSYDLLSFCESAGGPHGSSSAHQFFKHFIPGLINVAAGDLKLVGVPPRTAEEIEALPRDWNQLYLGSIAGLITEAYVLHGASAEPDLLYSAEVFYAATASARHDARLVAGYVARLLAGKRRPEPLPTLFEEQEQGPPSK